MTNTIESPANPNYTFGTDFDYSVWPKGSQVDLVNVPWNNDYRDIVRFANQTALDTYINGLNSAGIRLTQMSYLKPGENIRINIPFNRANRYNYLRVTNPIQPVPGGDVAKNYYYFILGSKYINPNTTELTLQLDVWTTYNFNVSFGNCYVQRGHISIANTNAFNNYGRDYLTVPEGLDTGSDYVVVDTEWSPIIDNRSSTIDIPNYSIIVTSTVDLIADPGTVSAPKLNSAKGSMFQGIVSGAAVYSWKTPEDFSNWLYNNADTPWLTQGIVSIAMVPPLDNYYSGISWPSDTSQPLDIGNVLIHKPDMPKHLMKNAWRSSPDIINYIPTRWRNLKKFLTSPYCVLELTAWQATPVVLRPELWCALNADVQEVTSFVAPAQRAMIYPISYNTPSYQYTYRDVGEFLDVATLISQFPQAMTVNNSAIAYMANNAHGIAYSYHNAEWSQQRVQMAASVAQGNAADAASADFQNSMTNIQAGMQQVQVANNLLQNQQINNAVGNVAGGAVNGLAGGAMAGPAGALGMGAAGVVGGLIKSGVEGANVALQQGANQASNAISNQAASTIAGTNINTALGIADSNAGLAKMVSRGDYENAVAGIQAKLQDTKMLQPTTSGQIGGDAFNIVNGLFGVTLKFKFIDPAHIAMIGDYWLRYGYAVNRFMQFPSNYMVMTNFTYWKLTETYISAANVPELFKQTIRGIFEKGVTVWADPTKIGNIDIADNDTLAGVSY
jgi:hypothetical protein